MDWKERKTWQLLGKVLTVTVDRPIGYCHNGMVYPVNYGFVPGIPGGDGEDLDAYILGVDAPVAQFTGQVVGVIRRHNDCEDKLVIAPEGHVYHQGQILEAVQFQEQYFQCSVDCLLQKSCGVIPYRLRDGQQEFLVVFEQFSKAWSLPKGHMEPSETEEQTALRELQEETGLQAVLTPGVRMTIRYPVGPVSQKEVVFFLGEASGQITIPESEIETYRWIRRQELGDYLFADTAAALESLLKTL